MAAPERARRKVAENRKARHNYFIDDTVEAGIMLVGTEVKSLRAGQANINEAYADMRDGDIYLVNAHIPEYTHGNRFNHDSRRPRKLLLHRREINKLGAASDRKGYTLVPLSIYFNDRGRAKVELGLARGKAAHDKRETIAKRDWERQKARLVKDYG
ncbi:MAG: SsrA-binding protein SmpB [Sphingomonadales bacterium]|jgi:SsrA-binding protein|nr:SsrA-binding protein SmpB [Sphingomonadales bacterium]RIK95656.1 MAG: SsrA-binding protein [Pseudomonadota bacterium]